MRPSRLNAPDMSDEGSTDFGFERVPRAEKARRVRGVFDSVADSYDLMNDLMSAGGQLLVLEFSHPSVPGLKRLYDAYSFRILPLLGRWVAGNEASYRYLAESIRMHPDQPTLLGMMQEAGLEGCRYHNLSGGIVAVHRGYRY